MTSLQFTLHDDVRPRGAQIAGAACTAAVPPEQLTFDRDREGLLQGHGSRVLAVQHRTTVSPCPAGTTRNLGSMEAVLDPKSIPGERLLVEQVAESPFEWWLVPVVADSYHAVLDPDGLIGILSERMAGDLGRPTGEILAVEQRDPSSLGGILGRRGFLLVAMKKEAVEQDADTDDESGHGRCLQQE